MATTTADCQRALITIPAEYLEDVRSALVRRIEDDGNALAVEQRHVLSASQDSGCRREDRASSARMLRRDMQLLDQLLEASGDSNVTAEHDSTSSPVTEMLEEMARVITERLADEMQFGPVVDMGAVLELATRLRWTAEEAIRIEPALAAATRNEAARGRVTSHACD